MFMINVATCRKQMMPRNMLNDRGWFILSIVALVSQTTSRAHARKEIRWRAVDR